MGTEPRSAILTGPAVPTLLRLAWPVLVSMVLHTLFNVVDAMWVGRLGSPPLAAVTTSMFATWMLLALGQIVAVGLTAVVSRRVGSGEHEGGDHAGAQGVLLALGFGAVLAANAGWAPASLFRLLGTAPEVSVAGREYLSPLVIASFAPFLSMALEAVIRAHGDTRTPMFAVVGALLLNFGLDPLFIFGWGGIPAFGVAGAAWATVLAQLASALVLTLHMIRRRDLFPHMGRHLARPDARVMMQLVRIGAPPCAGTLLFSFVYLFLSRVAAQLGTNELAVLGVGNRVESLCYLTSESLGIAAATFVGQNLGAGNPARARYGGRQASLLSFLLSGAIGLSYGILGPTLFALFTSDPAVRQLGGEYIRILAVSQPFMGIEIVLHGVFSGAGYTVAPTWISVVVSVLRVPLALVFAVAAGGGMAALGWILSLTCIARGLLLVVLFRRGHWIRTSL